MRLAYLSDMILGGRYEFLRDQLQTAQPSVCTQLPPLSRPTFQNGLLRLPNRQPVRFRRSQPASQPVLLLQAFETQGWPPEVETPLRSGQDYKPTVDAVYYINHRIRMPLLHTRCCGQFVSWTFE